MADVVFPFFEPTRPSRARFAADSARAALTVPSFDELLTVRWDFDMRRDGEAGKVRRPLEQRTAPWGSYRHPAAPPFERPTLTAPMTFTIRHLPNAPVPGGVGMTQGPYSGRPVAADDRVRALAQFVTDMASERPDARVVVTAAVDLSEDEARRVVAAGAHLGHAEGQTDIEVVGVDVLDA